MHKRQKKIAIAQRRDKVTEYYLKGKKQSEIAEMLGVTQATVSLDLKAIRDMWLESSLRDFDELKAQELAKIDELEAAYWAAWERSLGDVQTKTLRGNKSDQVKTIKLEEQNGDPRFLQGVERCIQKRCELLGLTAPAVNANFVFQQAVLFGDKEIVF